MAGADVREAEPQCNNREPLHPQGWMRPSQQVLVCWLQWFEACSLWLVKTR